MWSFWEPFIIIGAVWAAVWAGLVARNLFRGWRARRRQPKPFRAVYK